ncbi:MAG: DUF5060 domain-containing protein [Lysobacterales bacterium]|jgi:hypothetical protein
MYTRYLWPVLLVLLAPCVLHGQEITGELQQWHNVILTFEGPESSETADPSPFLDYRLNVTFSKGDTSLVIPGYFAADGNAAETSATSGNRWRVHFAPPETGTWTYQASFRAGPEVAVSLDPDAGNPAAFDGTTGTIEIGPSDKTGRDNRGRGMLQYVGEHFMRYAGTGEPFLLVGTQSPENFLAYYEFDNTKDYRGPKGLPHEDNLHHYDAHVQDWKEGDPTWQGGKGKAIIGVLNYLASKGMNAFYAVTMNNYGDAMDTNPWIAYEEITRYDVSKLAQWEIVFSHMDRVGLLLQMVMQEEEGDQTLGLASSTERRLYYRELVARFAHHHGLIWDMDEEMDRWRNFKAEEMKYIANYIRALDPYDHPIQYVQWKAELMDDMVTYGQLLGFENFDSLAMQCDAENTRYYTIKWLDKSAAAGHPWLVNLIEMNSRVPVDEEDFWHDVQRKHGIWGLYMAGGSGVAFFFTGAHNDLSVEDYRTRDNLFNLEHYAHDFFVKYLPFTQMHRGDDLTPTEDNYVLAANDGQTYAVYLPDGGTTEIDLSAVSGTFEVKWYDPRNGGELQDGTVQSIEGGGSRALGTAPADNTNDWTILIRKAAID